MPIGARNFDRWLEQFRQTVRDVCPPPAARLFIDRAGLIAHSLEAGIAAYKRTPTFDQDTLPSGLRRGHRTKAGVWALIHMVEGRLRYRILDPFSEEVLTSEKPGVVMPAQLHEVEPLDQVRLFVEFFSARSVEGGSHTSEVL